jgi:hypothetical protein
MLLVINFNINSQYQQWNEEGRIEKKSTYVIRFWFLEWLHYASKMTGYKFFPIALNGKLKWKYE